MSHIERLQCTNTTCRKQTTRDEAELRNFNTGLCAYCGYSLEPIPSPTHDSEDWLDEVLGTIFAAGLEKAKQYRDGTAATNTLMSDTMYQAKRQILAHYAHYLKPEDVERNLEEFMGQHERSYEAGYQDGLTALETEPGLPPDCPDDCDERHYHHVTRQMIDMLRARIRQAQLSKLNREEE